MVILPRKTAVILKHAALIWKVMILQTPIQLDVIKTHLHQSFQHKVLADCQHGQLEKCSLSLSRNLKKSQHMKTMKTFNL